MDTYNEMLDSLTVWLPLDLIYFGGGLLGLYSKHLLTIQSVDMNVLIDCGQRNEIHRGAICHM